MKKLLITSLIAFASASAFSWDEKWPVDVKITSESVVGAFLRANFGKIGELAAKQLDAILNDPAKQAKLAQLTINKLNSIYEKYQRDRVSGEENAKKAAAQEFIAAIEADIGGRVSNPSSGLNIKAAYSAKYGVTRLTWDRVKTVAACQRFVCACPDGSPRSGPGFQCQITEVRGGQTYYSYQPVACQVPSDSIELEAGYDIYRNSKLIASLDERRSIISSDMLPITGSIGPFSINLNIAFPGTAQSNSTTTGPFYDFDPQNENYGTPLKYTIKAKGSGCGRYNANTPYNNAFAFALNPASAEIVVDGNGDGRPDFYPEEEFVEARTNPSNTVTLSMDQSLWRGRSPAKPLTVAVSGNNPSGSVKVYIGSATLTIPVINGIAQLSESGYAHIPATMFCDCDWKAFAVYSGDANNAFARSATISVHVADYD